MKNMIFLLGLALAAQAQQIFETHIYRDNFPSRFELCRELAAVKAESIAKTKKEKIEVFQKLYRRCMKTSTGRI